MDAIAVDWIAHYPEYEEVLGDVEAGAECAALVRRLGEHEAHHRVMECLGEMIWSSQRNGTEPDGAVYVECVRKRAL